MAGRKLAACPRVHVEMDRGNEMFTFNTVVKLDPERGGNFAPYVVQLRVNATELARTLACQAIQKGMTAAALPARRVTAVIIGKHRGNDGGKSQG